MQLAYRGWENGFDTAVVVCASTHINAIMANGLAGAVDAPVLPVKPDRIPDAVASILRETKPSTIYFVDAERNAVEPISTTTPNRLRQHRLQALSVAPLSPHAERSRTTPSRALCMKQGTIERS